MPDYDLNWERLKPIVPIDSEWGRSFVADSVGATNECRFTLVGGLVNTNYSVKTERGKFFLRIVSGDNRAAKKEVALLPQLGADIPTPVTISTAAWGEHFVVLQEWIDGVTLKSKLASLSASEAYALATEIGEAVSRFKQLEFDTAGFMDGSARVATPFEMNPQSYLEYIDAALRQSHSILDPSVVPQVWKYVCQHACVLDGLPQQAWLTHGDLHANNLLVTDSSRPRLVGIIDWESALAWLPVHDLAHLLRRPLPLREELERGLIDGFTSAGGLIPGDWEELKRLLQLLGWVDKLATGEKRPNVISAAHQGLLAIVAAA